MTRASSLGKPVAATDLGGLIKRIALPAAGLALIASLAVPLAHHSHPATEASVASISTATVVAPTPVVLDDRKAELRALRASRSRPVATPKATHHVVVVHRAKPVVKHRSRLVAKVSTNGCTLSNWRSTLGTDERWVDEHESGMDPDSVNSSSGAYGLGQLLPSTYRDLGVPMTSNPCDQIQAQRKYMRGRYHTWAGARAFWESHRWW